jgi:hypothetical protein
MRVKSLVLAAASLVLSGCYHITVNSGATPAATVVDKQWQNSFVYGLVPPPEVNVKSDCPNGVAVVETEHSFLNGLVAALTWQLYTPMHVKVSCSSK